MQKHKYHKGIGMVEVLVAIGIVIIIISTLIFAFTLLIRFGLSNVERVQGTYLAEEGLEAVKHIRDEDYMTLSALTKDTPYYLEYLDDHWVVTTDNVYVDDIFERQFVVEAVNRDANDDIAVSGTTDPNTLLVTVSVAWKNREATTTKSISTYVTNLFQDE